MKKFTITIVILVMSISIYTHRAEAQWTSIGPNGSPIVASGSSENEIFISTRNYSVFRSLDNGNSWNLSYSTPYPEYYYINSIEVLPNYVLINLGWDLIRSSNNGNTWDRISYESLGPLNILKSINGILYLGDYGGYLQKSENNGDTWTSAGNFTIQDIGSSISDIVSNDSNIFVSDNYGRIYKGNNNETNWSIVLDSLNKLNISKLESFSTYLFASAYGKGILRSSDNGTTWLYFNNGLTNLYVNSLKHINSKLFAATNDGIFVSSDNGSSWIQANNGLLHLNTNNLIKGNEAILVGSNSNGIYKTTDNGNLWLEANNGFTGNCISSITSNSQYLFTGTIFGDLYRSSNNGMNWVTINNEIQFRYNAELLANDNFIFCGRFGYFSRSSNNGDNWEEIPDDRLKNTSGLALSNAEIFAVTSIGVLSSSNNGDSWIEKNNGLPNQRYVSSIYSYDGNILIGVGIGQINDKIYGTTDNGDNWYLKGNGTEGSINCFLFYNNFIFAAGSKGIFRSGNNGNSWQAVNQGIENLEVISLVSYGNVLFAGTLQGVYYSKDKGGTWHFYNDGFQSGKNITLLFIMNDLIYAGTDNESIWNRSLGEINQIAANDVGVVMISEPSPTIHYLACDSNLLISPAAKIYNYGSNNQHSFFNIKLEVSLNNLVVFSDIRHDTLSSGNERIVYFSQFNFNGASSGLYTMKCWTELISDTVNSNDTLVTTTTIRNPNIGGGLAQNMNYYFVNSTPEASCAPDLPVFHWEDTTGSISLISNGVAKIPLSEGNLNDGYFLLKNILPQGVVFKFDGICYDTFTVTTNGVVGLGSSTSGLLNSYIDGYPEINPFRGPTLFPLYFDFNFLKTSVTGRNLKYRVSGNKLIITYDKAPCNDTWSSNNYATFQLILETSSVCGMDNGIITYQFDNSKCSSEFLSKYYNGTLNAHVVGIQNKAGDKSIIYRLGKNNGTIEIPGPLFGSPLAVSFGMNNSVLPVELYSFTSGISESNVMLNWQTSCEMNNSGFDVERSIVKDQWLKIGFVKGYGNTVNVSNYAFKDKNLLSGKYHYRLKQIDFNGNYEYFNLSGEVIIGVPDKFELSQNYPNPFNPITVIRYSLSENGFTSLKIYDISGREVAKLINGKLEAGRYEVTFSGSNFASGVYFYELRSGYFVSQKRMLLLK